MQLFHSIDELRTALYKKIQLGKSIGLVPTMGALHEGHMSLVRAARSCDVVVVSIFVNPLQFNNNNDLSNYPGSLESDLAILKYECDMVFAPSYEAIYDHPPISRLDFGDIGNKLEGEFRPGHFNGVGVIVSKLFNIIQPDYAFFGLKDFQQYLLIKQLVKDLSFQVEIVGCPTVREESGLAMSSRNLKLSNDGLDKAAKIFEGLNIVKAQFNNGISIVDAKKQVLTFYQTFEKIEVEYIECVSDQLEILDDFPDSGEIIICIAAFVDGIRLIDNLYLRTEK